MIILLFTDFFGGEMGQRKLLSFEKSSCLFISQIFSPRGIMLEKLCIIFFIIKKIGYFLNLTF